MPAHLQLECFDGHDAAMIRSVADAEEAQLRAATEALAAEEKAEAERRHGELAALLRDLGTRGAELRQEALNRFVDPVRSALAALLPSLMRAGLDHELALATVALAGEQSNQTLCLAVHPAMHERLVNIVSGMEPANAIEITSDPALPEGSARLSWSDGGAVFDPAALLAQAEDLLTQRIDHIAGRTEADE